MELEKLLTPEKLNAFNLGCFFGTTVTQVDKMNANVQGIKIFEKYGILPKRENIIQCPNCSDTMRPVSDRGRELGWKYVCLSMRHRISATTNTFLEKTKFNECGLDVVIKLIYCWLRNMPVLDAQEEVCVSPDVAFYWYSNCREVASVIASHNRKDLKIENIAKINMEDQAAGEFIYKEFCLKRAKTIFEKFVMFLKDVSRVFPGVGKNRMVSDLAKCTCHMCQQ